ncbi:hypothetical protein [Pleurocapsa sp. PCC 7319]|uniref:hypothetical protein n=1 Tax=Pleurocapsa sp. PCC 7319 TaxID=118161 RepID=UPI000349BBAF|nr:hypothetical protein [Pleurocapsa sp. PCC 7319]
MDDWPQQWWKQLEHTAAEMEEFLVDVAEATESFVDEASENFSSFLEEFQSGVVDEVDSFIQDFIDVLNSTSDELDFTIGEEWEDFTDDDFTNVSYHHPSATSHPACINCANYHGRSYNGNLLVCGMHPEGWHGTNCPDWEKDQ